MSTKRSTILAGILTLGLLTAGASYAEEPGDADGWWPGWGMGPMMQNGPGWPFGMGWRYGDRIDRLDGRLAYLKTELKITDAQAGTWDAFAQAVKTSVTAHNEMMKTMHDQVEDDTPLPDRLSLHITLMESRLEQLKALKGASDQLYAALTPEQKKTADEILLPAMAPGGYGMWRWMMHG